MAVPGNNIFGFSFAERQEADAINAADANAVPIIQQSEVRGHRRVPHVPVNIQFYKLLCSVFLINL